MKKLVIALAALLVTVANYGQGTVQFANRDLTSGLDAPILLQGTGHGPGADYTAQLFLLTGSGASTTLTPLSPASTFNPTTGSIADRYIKPVTIEVPGVAGGSSATFVVRAWLTSAGSYEAAVVQNGQSAPFTVASLGGAGNPPSTPAFMTGLQSFQVGILPEPSVIVLGVLGGAAFLFRRLK